MALVMANARLVQARKWDSACHVKDSTCSWLMGSVRPVQLASTTPVYNAGHVQNTVQLVGITKPPKVQFV
jgi:hypothetical protein